MHADPPGSPGPHRGLSACGTVSNQCRNPAQVFILRQECSVRAESVTRPVRAAPPHTGPQVGVVLTEGAQGGCVVKS